MTDRERLNKLGKCYQNYLGGRMGEDMQPIEGYDDKFYDGVLWAFARFTEIYPPKVTANRESEAEK